MQNLWMPLRYYKELIAVFVLLSGRTGIFKCTVYFSATKATNGKHFNDENVLMSKNLLNMEEGRCVFCPSSDNT